MLGIGSAVSIRTLRPGDFYLLFPDLVTLGFVLANGEATSRFDLNGKHARQIRSIDDARCIERFKGSELSIQLGGYVAGNAQSLKTGSLVVAKAQTRQFLAIQLPEPHPFVFVDLKDWKLTHSLPGTSFDVHNNWKLLRGWDGTLVHQFH